ncbi:hypothetical protein ACTMSH_02845, partial [Klebsiella grimontii]
LNRLIRCVCGKKIGPDPRNFNQRVSLGRNDLLIRTFPSGQAVTVVSPETKSNFLTSVTLNAAQTQQNSLFGTSLTLTNGQANNAVGFSANSGRKINFVLPADSDATQNMPYFVELEMM